MDFTPEHLAKAATWATQVADKAVEHIAMLESLKEAARDMLSSLMSEIDMGLEKKMSEAQLERLARGTKKWAEFQNGRNEATKKALEWKVKVKNGERYWATCQSGLSYRKSEMERIS